MAIKLSAADFTARTGITEGSIVRWRTDPPDTTHTATVVILHDTGIELEWGNISQAQYSLEEAIRNFALVSSGAPASPDSPREYTWRKLAETAPMDTPEAARSFVLGVLAYQTAETSRPAPPAMVQMALSVETRKDAENLFRDLFNFSHRHILRARRFLIRSIARTSRLSNLE